MYLFNRLRGVISGNQADVDLHSWKLPSSYSSSKPGGKQTVIPDPSIFVNAFPPPDAEVGNAATILACPDISHAAVHLALLECFRTLRLEASELQVDVHGLPAYTEKPRDDFHSNTTTKLPESQRWDLLIRLAISRFAVWWTNIDHVLVHIAAYGHHAGDKVMVQLTKEYLPPLDVLLVWYAFMLDSDAYKAACRDHERRVARLEHLCFPWLAIRDVIDMDTFRFELPRTAQNLFSTLSTQSSDSLTYLESPPAYTEAIDDIQAVSELCQCWTCERIRDNVPTFRHTPTPSATPSSSTTLSSSTSQQLSCLSSEQLRQIQDDLGFYFTVEKARERGGPLPTRPTTAREKAAEAAARAKQKEVGYRPGLNEYLEILPDGTRKIRRQKHVNAWGNLTSI
ncbi:hypothetical protein NCS52_01500000 [Fusarium sp. LHS14.1]|nr:hypothetical protein NCS52_01500000 [Fusarium sp. LHS14.1]